jgi:hypothetical protein
MVALGWLILAVRVGVVSGAEQPPPPAGADAAVADSQRAVQECYRRAGWDYLFLHVKHYVTVTVDKTGRATSIEVEGPTQGPMASLQPCFVAVLSRRSFPIAPDAYQLKFIAMSFGSPAQRRGMAEAARRLAIFRFELVRGSPRPREHPFGPGDCTIDVTSNAGIVVWVDGHLIFGRPMTRVEVKAPCGRHILEVAGNDDSREKTAVDLHPGKPVRKNLQQARMQLARPVGAKG